MTQSQSSVIKLSSFIFLPPDVSDSKTEGDASLPTFLPGAFVIPMLSSPNFFTTQSQSFVIKFSSFIFLPLEVSDNKPGMDGRDKPLK